MSERSEENLEREEQAVNKLYPQSAMPETDW